MKSFDLLNGKGGLFGFALLGLIIAWLRFKIRKILERLEIIERLIFQEHIGRNRFDHGSFCRRETGSKNGKIFQPWVKF